ncbi:MAG TPA: response regulator [bacterium]|nr:response regulator [bacterium]
MTDKKKILLVDDDITIIDVLTTLLENEYQIQSATNGKAGLEKVRVFHPDLIILDLVMPGCDGFEFCEVLKNDEAFKNIPVIVLSSHTHLIDTRFGSNEKLKLAVPDHYLSKPVDPVTILREIRNYIG